MRHLLLPAQGQIISYKGRWPQEDLAQAGDICFTWETYFFLSCFLGSLRHSDLLGVGGA